MYLLDSSTQTDMHRRLTILCSANAFDWLLHFDGSSNQNMRILIGRFKAERPR